MKIIPVRKLNNLQQYTSDAQRFNIRRIEDILQGKDLIHDLHRHNFFFILSVQHGKGNHEIDFTLFRVLDHSLFFLRPGQVHQLELKAGSSGYLLEFNIEFYNPKDPVAKQRLRKAGNNNYCIFRKDQFERIHTVLTSLFREYSTKEEGYLDVIRAGLEIFFIELARQTHDGVKATNNYTQERYEEFLELLDRHITRHKQVSFYTNLMSLSAYQLNEITKSSADKTASQLINEQILLEAKRFLIATPNQVKEIADQLGYEDPSYFIRFFKKHAGHSPEAFREGFK